MDASYRDRSLWECSKVDHVQSCKRKSKSSHLCQQMHCHTSPKTLNQVLIHKNNQLVMFRAMASTNAPKGQMFVRSIGMRTPYVIPKPTLASLITQSEISSSASTPSTSSSITTPSTATADAASTSAQTSSNLTHFRITLHRSAIGLPARTKQTLEALGIHRRMQTVFHKHTPDIAGKILKVKELVEVTNVPASAVRTPAEMRVERKAVRGYEVVVPRHPERAVTFAKAVYATRLAPNTYAATSTIDQKSEGRIDLSLSKRDPNTLSGNAASKS